MATRANTAQAVMSRIAMGIRDFAFIVSTSPGNVENQQRVPCGTVQKQLMCHAMVSFGIALNRLHPGDFHGDFCKGSLRLHRLRGECPARKHAARQRLARMPVV
ncbi:MAG: hypothetical protein ACTHJP_04525 [Rhodanobacteraceae bacterium]